MTDHYDVVIIGAGPGGYVAAIRAAQLGLKAACVESRGSLGGTCLNIGCIPSKALLQSSEKFAEVGRDLDEHGVKVSEVSLDLGTMMGRKDNVVTALTRGVEFLFRKNKVDWLKGKGRIAAPGRVVVIGADGAMQELETGSIVIATGSESTPLPGIEIDEKRIVSSTGALALGRVPGRLVVIGGGYIGLELGSVWQRLGAKVTVVEVLDHIVPSMDRELGTALQRVLARSGMEFKLGTKVAGVEEGPEGLRLDLEGAAVETLSADVVLVAIGRRPYTAGLGLEAVGVALDEHGRVIVDDGFATNVPGVYAIGDVIRGPMLAHKAMDEGIALAERLAGQKTTVDYDAIPAVIYTWPEVASVGKTEEELKGCGDILPGREVRVHRQCARPDQRLHRGLCQNPRRQRDRPGARRPHHRPRRRHPDCRGRARQGIRRLGRGYRAHLPRPPDVERGLEGSGTRRRRPGDLHLKVRRAICRHRGVPAPRTG